MIRQPRARNRHEVEPLKRSEAYPWRQPKIKGALPRRQNIVHTGAHAITEFPIDVLPQDEFPPNRQLSKVSIFVATRNPLLVSFKLVEKLTDYQVWMSQQLPLLLVHVS